MQYPEFWLVFVLEGIHCDICLSGVDGLFKLEQTRIIMDKLMFFLHYSCQPFTTKKGTFVMIWVLVIKMSCHSRYWSFVIFMFFAIIIRKLVGIKISTCLFLIIHLPSDLYYLTEEWVKLINILIIIFIGKTKAVSLFPITTHISYV